MFFFYNYLCLCLVLFKNTPSSVHNYNSKNTVSKYNGWVPLFQSREFCLYYMYFLIHCEFASILYQKVIKVLFHCELSYIRIVLNHILETFSGTFSCLQRLQEQNINALLK